MLVMWRNWRYATTRWTTNETLSDGSADLAPMLSQIGKYRHSSSACVAQVIHLPKECDSYLCSQSVSIMPWSLCMK